MINQAKVENTGKMGCCSSEDVDDIDSDSDTDTYVEIYTNCVIYNIY